MDHPRREHPECNASAEGSAELRIGEHVRHDGRLYAVVGLDPMGVPGRRADLEDVETGERIRVPVSELEPQD